jgi:hypothetical protein
MHLQRQNGLSRWPKIENLYNNLAEKGTDARILEVKFGSAVNAIDSLNRLMDVIWQNLKKILHMHILWNTQCLPIKSVPCKVADCGFFCFLGCFLAVLVFLILDYRKTT